MGSHDGQPVVRHHPERLGSSRRPSDAGAARGGNAPGLSLGSGRRTESRDGCRSRRRTAGARFAVSSCANLFPLDERATPRRPASAATRSISGPASIRTARLGELFIDMHEGRRRFSEPDEQFRDRDLGRPAIWRAARDTSTRSRSPASSRRASFRATTRSGTQPRSSTMSSASSRSPILDGTTSCTFRRPAPPRSSFAPRAPLPFMPLRSPEDSPGLAARSWVQSRLPGRP